MSASGHDYYFVWTTSAEQSNGGRRIYSMESHTAGAFLNTWSAPENVVGPDVLTRTGLGCAIDRSTERLIVAFTGMDEGIYITHRPSLVAGAGQWSGVTRVQIPVDGHPASTYGPPDLAFDFFNPFLTGTLTWQDNADLRNHTVSVEFSGGSYIFGGTRNVVHANDPSMQRSWPVVSFEETAILGLSVFDPTGLPSIRRFAEERRSLPFVSPFYVSSESYEVGAIHAARRYTSAASNLQYIERSFLSTAIVAQ